MALRPLFRVMVFLRRTFEGEYDTSFLLSALVKSVTEVAPELMKELCTLLGDNYRAPYNDSTVFAPLFVFDIRGGEKVHLVTITQIEPEPKVIVSGVRFGSDQRKIRRAFREGLQVGIADLRNLDASDFVFSPYSAPTEHTPKREAKREPENESGTVPRSAEEYYGFPL